MGPGDNMFTPAFRYSRCVRRVMENSQIQAEMLGAEAVGTEHLLLAMLGEHECAVRQILAGLGVDIESLQKSLTGMRRGPDGRRDDAAEGVRAHAYHRPLQQGPDQGGGGGRARPRDRA